MEALGAPTMLVCSNVSPHAIDDDALAAAQLHELAERADERGLQDRLRGARLGPARERVRPRVADRRRRPTTPRSAPAWTPSTSSAAAPTWTRSTRIPGEKIFFLQLADAPHLRMDVLQWSRHYRCFPGQGALDVAGFVDARARRRLQRPAVARGLQRRLPPGRPVPHGGRRDALAARARGRAAPAARARSTASRSSSSPSSAPRRDRGPAARDGLRPRRPAPHQAGPAVASTATSASCSTTAASDPEVVAVAVAERGPGRVGAARAEALLAPVLERRRGPGEADLTAVAAPDGTSVFFCGRRTGSTTSSPTGESGGDGVPIERIDHITLAQPFDAFDEAGLFYRSRPRPPAERQPGARRARRARPQPRGRQRDGGVRVVLNVPALAGTRTAGRAPARRVRLRRRARRRGAMRERGVPLLAVPEQLLRRPGGAARARPGLLPLRELGVLYDRSPEGELLHFYTARIGGRVFFEVLERRGGYDGYGALNSPVRMAAQGAVANRHKEERHAATQVGALSPSRPGRFAREGALGGARAAGARRRCAS